ncbi:virulence factor TspB C-terminal domain-related protein [Trinickia sp. YCB016]
MRKQLFRKWVLAIALLSLLVQQQRVAQAQAVPVLEEAFSGTINEVIASAVESNLARRGITVAANDATMVATEQYIGNAVNNASYGSAALTALASIAGAPVWLTVALGVGALAAVGAVSWGLYTLSQSSASSGKTPDGSPMPMALSLTPTTPDTTDSGSPAPAGSYTSYCDPTVENTSCAIPLPPYLEYYVSGMQGATGVIGCVSASDCAQQVASFWVDYYRAQGFSDASASWAPESAGSLDDTVTISSASFGAVVRSSAPVSNPNYTPPLQQESGTLSAIQPDITSSMLTDPAPQQLLADMANQLWQDASLQPGYNGEPYSATDPITAQDVASAPETATWNDLLTAPAPVGTTAVPISPTVTPGSSTSTGTNPASSPTGTSTPDSETNPCQIDPTASACQSLGTAPTAPPIPTSSASVTMSQWSIGPASGQCPSPITVNVMGAPLVFDYSPLCSLASQLQPLVLALCALGAALIVVMGIRS